MTEFLGPGAAAVTATEFLLGSQRVERCHASTVAQHPGGLLVACFGGSHEGHDDVGIWLTREVEGRWTEAERVADGRQAGGERFPCWNPVLFWQPPGGPLLLFYKCGPRPGQWWGLLARSHDGGLTWGPHERLPDGFLGPIKNKPVLLPDGALLCPSSSEHDGWRVHIERTSDGGRTWHRSGPINDGHRFAAIQPSILTPGGACLQVLCRSKRKVILGAWSEDGGHTWGDLASIDLPNPNAGTDAVTLRDGRHLLVYNHSTDARTPLNVAISENGRHWKEALVLESGRGEYSYPAVIQAADGLVHITYTWKRLKIRHVVLDPQRL